MQTDATSANNSQHCWVLLANNVAPVCMGLKVWPVLNYMQQVPTSANIVVLLCKRTQQVTTLLGPTMLGVVGQQCWVRLHGALGHALNWNLNPPTRMYTPSGACDKREAGFSFFLIFLIRRLSSLREQRNRRRRRILRFAMLNRITIRRRQQISLLPALQKKLCQEMLYTCGDSGPSRGTCGLKRSRWDIFRSRREFIISLSLPDWQTDRSLFVCVACSKRGIGLAWSRCRPVRAFERASGADTLSKIKGHTESIL